MKLKKIKNLSLMMFKEILISFLLLILSQKLTLSIPKNPHKRLLQEPSIQNCKNPEGLDPLTKTCKKCKIENCENCESNFERCEKCTNSFFYQISSVDSESPSEPKYLCMPCLENCQKCTSIDNCYNCVSGFRVKKTDKERYECVLEENNKSMEKSEKKLIRSFTGYALFFSILCLITTVMAVILCGKKRGLRPRKRPGFVFPAQEMSVISRDSNNFSQRKGKSEKKRVIG